MGRPGSPGHPHLRCLPTTSSATTASPSTRRARSSRAATRPTTHTFTERFTFGPGGDWDDPAVAAAVRILYLLAGVSYYKTTAAPADRPGRPPDDGGRAGLPHAATTSTASASSPTATASTCAASAWSGPDAGTGAGRRRYEPEPGPAADPLRRRHRLHRHGRRRSRRDHPDAALCVVDPPGDRFAAIEDAAAVTGLPVIRVVRARSIPSVRRSAELGFLNGHVPVTAIDHRRRRSWPRCSNGATPSCSPTNGRPPCRRSSPTGAP